MTIKELSALSEAQVKDVISLMGELNPSIVVTPEMLRRSVASASSHFFAIIEDIDHIIGCATLCVYDSPTGRKASVEDVVVHLTSNPRRVAANELYKKLGFERRESNFYGMRVGG